MLSRRAVCRHAAATLLQGYTLGSCPAVAVTTYGFFFLGGGGVPLLVAAARSAGGEVRCTRAARYRPHPTSCV